jgi:hypothetical protein
MTRASPEYEAWMNMRKRCFYPKGKDNKYYGGRGITVCDRWSRFDYFLLDMGERPSPQHSLDRVNNHLDYTPDNCMWATKSQQMRNRRRFTRASSDNPMRYLSRHQKGWRVRITLQPKKQFQQLCASLDEAIALRDLLEYERAVHFKLQSISLK